MLTISIDWLAVTFKEFNHETEPFIRTYAMFPTVQTTNARNGYTQAQRDGRGVELFWNPDYSGMGHHAVFSGSALRNIFASGVLQPTTLLRACINAGGSISRLDLAKDFTEGEVNYEAVYQSLKQRSGGGNARKITKLESSDNGFTVYVGSRQSERFLRLYDKAAESKLPGELWARLELETKGMVARAVATSLNRANDWAGVFDSVVLGMVGDAKATHLEMFFTPGVVPIGLPKIERRGDTEKWIGEQVIPAVCRYYIENPTSEAVTRLIEALAFIDRQRAE